MNMSRRAVYGLAVIVCVVSIVLVLVGVPYQAGVDRAQAARDECAHSLFHLFEAKCGWAQDHHAVTRAETAPGSRALQIVTNVEPSWSDLRPYYFGPTRWPSIAPAPLCPGGGTWTIGRLSESPTCSIAAHTAAFRRNMEEAERGRTNGSSQ
jgi:hypothetical protein